MWARTSVSLWPLLLIVVTLAGCQGAGGPERVDAIPGENEPTRAEGILASTHLAAARLHESQGRDLMAVQQYQLALKSAPGNVVAWGRLGVVLDRMGDGAAAQQAYQKALTLKPQDAQLRNNLGFSYCLQAKWDLAEQELRQALEVNPGLARARINLAMALAQQERFDEALAEFKLALPEADALFNLGLMYQSKRLLVDAAVAYKSALEIEPQLEAARKHLEKLELEVLTAADDRIAEQKALAAAPPEEAAPAEWPELNEALAAEQLVAIAAAHEHVPSEAAEAALPLSQLGPVGWLCEADGQDEPISLLEIVPRDEYAFSDEFAFWLEPSPGPLLVETPFMTDAGDRPQD